MMNPYRGSSFDRFLEEEGMLAECTQEAMRRITKLKHPRMDSHTENNQSDRRCI